MIRLFLENAPTRMEQIRRGVTTRAVEEAEKGAHSLKSSAANVGAEAIRTLAAEMERSATDGDVGAVTRQLPALEEAFTEGIQALESFQRGLGS
jgi:HPt (histidine-containing phosphotransfer) domain-containing protein